MIKYIILGLSVPIIAFLVMYNWEKLESKNKNRTLTTAAAVFAAGIILLIILLVD
tara:strand:- start:925 stop:1089 length:165 start_codon:yes stop_codon:yes gene_type:complete